MRTIANTNSINQTCWGLAVTLLLTACNGGDMPAAGPEAVAAPDYLQQGRGLLFDASTRFEYPEAVALLEKAVMADEEDGAARVALSYAYTKLGKYVDAEPHIVAAKAIGDELSRVDSLWLAAVDARVADDVDREVMAWQVLADEFPNDRWGWYELAAALSTQPNYSEAAAAAEQALKLEPDPAKWESSWIYYLHAKSLFRSGQIKAAIPAGEAGRGSATTWRSTFYRLALAQIAAEELRADEAVTEYRKISTREGRNDESYTEANIALFYFELGDYSSAASHAQVSLDLAQGAYQYWTLSYSLSESGMPLEGLEAAERGAKAYPQDSRVLAAKGWALYRLGRLDEAKAALLAAKATSPRRIYRIEESLAVVDRAIKSPAAPAAAPIPWLG